MTLIDGAAGVVFAPADGREIVIEKIMEIGIVAVPQTIAAPDLSF